MAGNKIILHSYAPSSCSWRVRAALIYKGIPYEYKAWDLSKEEHMSDEYKEINPGSTVPSLEIDGAVINDSIAILEYLEERFPEKPLLPKDPIERARIRVFVNQIASGIQPSQNLRILNKIASMGGESAKVKWARAVMTSGFEALESTVKKTAGKFCFGDEFTLADILLACQLPNACRFKVDFSKFPTLVRLEKTLNDLDVIKKSSPQNQPDFPGCVLPQ